MWPKFYKDYQIDTALIKERVEPSAGIVGCEMHDINGWGNTLHIPKNDFRKNFNKDRLNGVGEEDDTTGNPHLGS